MAAAAASASPTTPSSMSAASSSSSRSPNHPDNLRKQALLLVDATSSDFTVKSYIGAADQLLEKAEAADRQGQLEQAFVNYIKAASVAASIPKHADWNKIVRERHPTYSRYQDLMHRVPSIVKRSKRIEEQLREREERTAQLYREQAVSEASAVSSSASDGHAPSASLSSSQSTQARALNGNQQPSSQATGLEARLAALRTAGVTGALVGPNHVQSGSHGGEAEDIDAPTDGAVAEALRQSAGSPTPQGDSSFAMRAAADPHDTPSRASGATSPQLDDVDKRFFPHLPTADEFSSTFPSLDDFERGAESQFPTPPSHKVGKKGSRPLPAPPAPPTDVQLARDVPSAFVEERDAREVEASSSSAVSPPQPATSRSRPALPTAPKPVKGPRIASTSAAAPKGDVGSMTPPAALLPGSGAGDVGDKPTPPRSAFVSVEELYKLLHPGFEKSSVVVDGVQTTRIARRRGLEILLLDVRSRDEFGKGRIKAKSCVCLEPITLRKDMSSEDLENKLVLSPLAEQEAFALRDKFDLVVIYDGSYRPPAPGASSSDTRLMENIEIVRSAIYEREFRRPLKHHAVVLIGGFDSWKRKVGKQDVASDEFPNGEPESSVPSSVSGAAAAAASMSHATNGTKHRLDGQRTSISLESGSRHATPLASPSEMRRGNPLDDMKRERRQAQILPDGEGMGRSSFSGGAYDRSSITPMMPVAPSQAYRGSSNSTFSPGSSAAAAFSGPSMPARVYQAATSTDSSSSYTSTPYYPSAPSAPAPLRPKSGAFEYPQLSSSSRQRDHAAQVQPPPVAAAANGVGSRPVASPASGSVVPRSAYGAVGAQRTGAASSAQYSTYSQRRANGGKEVHIGMTGLKNVGNSCYMNSTLQCLSASIPLARFMLDGSYKGAINKVNPLGTQGALAEAFAQLLRVLWSERYTFVSPVTFREAITRFAPAFRGYDQHDSQEFLVFLLDGLHEDLNFVLNKPAPVEMTKAREDELETLPQQIASLKEWSIYRQRNDSLIVDWFQGQFRNKMTCLTCGKTSTTYNAFINLSLPIPAGRGISRVTLQQCLDAFVREEVMDKADAWYCPRCKKPRKATKRLSISRLPHLLLIHLKRFSFRGPFTDKIETLVDFPRSRLDLTNYMPPPLPPAAIGKDTPTSVTQQPPFLYDLYAVTHHFGSLNTGHYTATIRNDGSWLYCDDSRISKGDERQLGTNSPYVLWYRRSPN